MGVAAALLLGAVYAATLAPGLTFWDAGEFIAAAHSFGIPHPPGTPLFVAVDHAWTRLLGAVARIGTAYASNLLSAVCSAVAAGILGSLVARWTRSATAGLAAALVAGTSSSVWLNATETEVYAASLLLSALALWCGDRRSRDDGASGWRWTALLAYCFALAPALHLSSLVAAPAAAALAVQRRGGGVRRGEAVALGAAALLAAGVGAGARTALAGGGALLVALPAARLARRARGVAGEPNAARLAAVVLVASALGASALLVMYFRARHDPALDQGDPSTLAALLDVVWRRQYEPVPLFPRRAPLWLQLGNLVEYADWQWALGLHPSVEPSWRRTPVTLLMLALGVAGALAHRRLDRRSFRATALLLAGASVGVVLYLNLRAGPSFGGGLLPDDALHEARERDYFFALAFWTWGAWAGLGAAALASRGGWRRVSLAAAALPLVLNWRAVDRRREPEASTPRALAEAMLGSAPPDAVLLVAGDNDTYPLWYLQVAEGVRRDVTVVTVPLLGAPWYRGELARRHALLDATAPTRWSGELAAVREVARGARAQRRPVVVSVALPAATRAAAGAVPEGWSQRGLVYVEAPGVAAGEPWPAADSTETAAWAERLRGVAAARPDSSTDAAMEGMHALLSCPGLALAAGGGAEAAAGARALLDSQCNRR